MHKYHVQKIGLLYKGNRKQNKRSDASFHFYVNTSLAKQLTTPPKIHF